jgi:hypothetical protein
MLQDICRKQGKVSVWLLKGIQRYTGDREVATLQDIYGNYWDMGGLEVTMIKRLFGQGWVIL